MRTLLPAFAIVSLSLSGCQPPAPATTERIIRIQIEGCEDATPLPLIATPIAVQTPTQFQTNVAVAAVSAETPIATETPAVMQPRVERTPVPPVRTPQALADEYNTKREGFLAELASAKLHPLDVPSAYENFRRADDFLRARNYDEALRYVEVALYMAKEVRINEAFVTAKFNRVDARVNASRPKLTVAEQERAAKMLKRAYEIFPTTAWKQTNAVLYDIDLLLDRKLSSEPAPGPRKNR